jgi:hypothetical protein
MRESERPSGHDRAPRRARTPYPMNASMPSVRPPAPELLHVLMLPDFDRADRIGPY